MAVDSAGIKTAGRRRRPRRRRHSGAEPSWGVFLRPREGRGSERVGGVDENGRRRGRVSETARRYLD